VTPLPERGLRDARIGSGALSRMVEMPTVTIPGDCLCTWRVVRAGPGLACISSLWYRSGLCRHRHQDGAGGGRISA
jgi:hypothetical protein